MAGNTFGATESLSSSFCSGSIAAFANDVWYQFIAEATTQVVTVDGAANMNAVVEVRSGNCNGTAVTCVDATADDGTETITLTGLTPGVTYLIRVYDFLSAGGGGDFTICVTTLAPPNDNCANAVTLTPGAACTPTAGTTVGATQSLPAIACGVFIGSANDDVWYQFTATATNHTVTVVGTAGFDPVVDVRSGSCNGTNIACADASSVGGTENVALSGLTSGATYLVRVYRLWQWD